MDRIKDFDEEVVSQKWLDIMLLVTANYIKYGAGVHDLSDGINLGMKNTSWLPYYTFAYAWPDQQLIYRLSSIC